MPNQDPYQDSAQIFTKLTNKSFVAIIPHRSPDGDAIGSAIALKLFIQQYHPNVEIICTDPPPQNTEFIHLHHSIHHNLDLSTFTTLCFVDCGNEQQSNFQKQIPDLFNRKDIFKINIDHHQSNPYFGDLNIVDTTSASTTQILFNLFTQWKAQLTPEIATALLTGIHFDTGSFKHPNTTLEVLRIASILTQFGANNQTISTQLFRKSSVKKLKLWGQILANTKLSKKSIVTSAVTQKELSENSSTSKDLEGIIDYLNAIPNKKFSMLLTEDQDGIKASLRTLNSEYNLNTIANIFGGGGHSMAAGFKIDGKLKKQIYWKIE